jgi:hypothetical protein
MGEKEETGQNHESKDPEQSRERDKELSQEERDKEQKQKKSPEEGKQIPNTEIADKIGCTTVIIVILLIIGTCGLCGIPALMNDPSVFDDRESMSSNTKAMIFFFIIVLGIAFFIYFNGIWGRPNSKVEESKAPNSKNTSETDNSQ